MTLSIAEIALLYYFDMDFIYPCSLCTVNYPSKGKDSPSPQSSISSSSASLFMILRVLRRDAAGGLRGDLLFLPRFAVVLGGGRDGSRATTWSVLNALFSAASKLIR